MISGKNVRIQIAHRRRQGGNLRYRIQTGLAFCWCDYPLLQLFSLALSYSLIHFKVNESEREMSNESEGELNVWFLCHQVTEVFWSHFLIHRDDAQDNTIRWESREDENQGKII